MTNFEIFIFMNGFFVTVLGSIDDLGEPLLSKED